MPATERYQIDFFAIIVLIAAVLIIVFLVISAIYFYNLMNLKPPSKGESTFLFWTAIILAVIFLALAIYALIHIFTHKAIVYEEPPVVAAPIVTPAPVPIVVPQTTFQALPQKQIVTTPPVRISNVPRSDVSTSFSDAPLTRPQRNSLNQELISIGEAVED